MGASVGGNNDGPMADINVTPLIDVVLVLLVVFMVITPLLSSGLPVDLPQATSSEPDKEGGQHVVISITKDGEFAVGQEKIDQPVDVAIAVRTEILTSPDPNERKVLVKADKDVPYGKAREILDELAQVNLTNVFIATNKE